MSFTMSDDYAIDLVNELRKLPAETEYVEFKVNNADPERIGAYISALANAAALIGKTRAYLIWGIENDTHEIVGTKFFPSTTRVGNNVLENWLLQLLEPKIGFFFKDVNIDEKRVVILSIERAYGNPVRFKSEGYIRIDSTLKKLKDAPPRERDLWRALDETPFERRIAAERVSSDQLLKVLDYPAYFRLLDVPLPEGRKGILRALAEDEIIVSDEAGAWNVTNLGAVLFAASLSTFESVRRKAIRVIEYRGKDRIETHHEHIGGYGYAAGFSGLIEYINRRLPGNEEIGQAFRTEAKRFPPLAVRELVANALIHQDFSISGAGPTVEIFKDRIEITNPGEPLVETNRFLDSPPRSRNEGLASLMRRMGICEERGSGIDKVIFQTEFYQLPAPLFESVGQSTRVTLLGPIELSDMNAQDRIRACYFHACLKYVNREFVTNSTIRRRFGIEKQNAATASRLLNEARKAGVIRLYDPEAARAQRKYVPFWAKE